MKSRKIKDKRNPNELTVNEHLSELKKRTITALFTIITLFILFLWKSKPLITMILQEGKSAGYLMIAISPQETLLQQINTCFICSLIMSIPAVLYEAGMFISPAIGPKYKKYLWASMFAGIVLFAAGMCFAIKIIIPFALVYMKSISQTLGVTLEISVANYISLYATIATTIGMVFEMPIASLLLSKAGLITSEGLKKYKKPAIIVILIIAALITPPDVISQMLVFIPMLALYEISIALCGISERKGKVLK